MELNLLISTFAQQASLAPCSCITNVDKTIIAFQHESFAVYAVRYGQSSSLASGAKFTSSITT